MQFNTSIFEQCIQKKPAWHLKASRNYEYNPACAAEERRRRSFDALESKSVA